MTRRQQARRCWSWSAPWGAEKADVRLCALYGAAAALDPVLRGFDHIGNDS
ncbi:hypothetical protein [Streptomyces pilosus]|uniref:Uncharacterized protein n=1 Tax=Streptomyces pilosus TaxID=28893 RepID=A0A918C7J2_9ACTN|nr:hypothetical protein [Streptomyces pilosus]GGR09865.1 hypothetical protein GCM10010280_66990 [Streptomyces pilosus]